MRAEFLGMVSHELRTPLTAIKGSAAMVLDASRVLDPVEVRQFFRIINEQADQMDGLIGDLLDAGSIDAGTLSVDPEPSDLRALVEQARTTFLSGGSKHDRPHRPAAGSALGAGGPPAHRAGDEQPVVQRGPALARDLPDTHRRRARGRARRGPGLGPKPGRFTGTPRPAVQQVRRERPRGRPDQRPRSCHLQGAGRSPRGAHPGGERGAGPGYAPHLHHPGCRRGPRRRLRSACLRSASEGTAAHAASW